MITKNQIRFVKSLQQKKYRNEYGLFVVEGRKSVEEVLQSSLTVQKIYVSKLEEVPEGLSEFVEISSTEMKRLSGLKTAPGILAVVQIPSFSWDNSTKGITLLLDDISDPGNLGTIIRSADWFGVERIICSPNTVDLWNPKVVQATMGSLFHVPIFTLNLEEVLAVFEDKKVPSFAAVLNGENLYDISFPEDAAIIIGNESHGISQVLVDSASHAVTIPAFGRAESLNASVACAVILGVMKRG